MRARWSPTQSSPAQRQCSNGSETAIPRSSATEITVDTGAIGQRFADALGRKDFDAITDLLDPMIDFRALTPRRVWEASSAYSVVAGVLRQWFDDGDELEEIVSIDVDSVADRQRVAYRFRGRNADGPFVVEQQAYYIERAGRIAWMRVLCSGFRPA
jgi:hypothetical protein